jgi:hypothetical protein
MSETDLSARVAALELRSAQIATTVAVIAHLAESPELLDRAMESGKVAFLVAEADRLAIEARQVAHIPKSGDLFPEGL